MYTLYFKKKDCTLLIKPIKNDSRLLAQCTDEVTVFNDCYLLCNDRKKLKQKAEELKEKWIKELEEELQKLKNMKIQVKYR